MELTVSFIGTAYGEEVAEKGQNGSHYQHQGGQSIQHQHDPERWLPVTECIDPITAIVCHYEEHNGGY